MLADLRQELVAQQQRIRFAQDGAILPYHGWTVNLILVLCCILGHLDAKAELFLMIYAFFLIAMQLL